MGGKTFGNLGIKSKNIISYSLSPFEQKAFAGFFSKGVGNLYRRFRSQVFYVAPGMLWLAAVYTYATHEHHRLSRKNPKDFEDEV
eukprot:gene3691-14957_t